MIIIFVIFILVTVYAILIYILEKYAENAKVNVLKAVELENALNEKPLHDFLNAHTEYTEETFKEYIKQTATQVINRTLLNHFNTDLSSKMINDSNLDKFSTLELKKITIIYYGRSTVTASIVYTNNIDEYNLTLLFDEKTEQLSLKDYQAYRIH